MLLFDYDFRRFTTLQRKEHARATLAQSKKGTFVPFPGNGKALSSLIATVYFYKKFMPLIFYKFINAINYSYKNNSNPQNRAFCEPSF